MKAIAEQFALGSRASNFVDGLHPSTITVSSRITKQSKKAIHFHSLELVERPELICSLRLKRHYSSCGVYAPRCVLNALFLQRLDKAADLTVSLSLPKVFRALTDPAQNGLKHAEGVGHAEFRMPFRKHRSKSVDYSPLDMLLGNRRHAACSSTGASTG